MIRYQQVIKEIFDQVCSMVQPIPFRFIFQPLPKSSRHFNANFVTCFYFIPSIDVWMYECCVNTSQSCDLYLFLPYAPGCNSNIIIFDQSDGKGEHFSSKSNFQLISNSSFSSLQSNLRSLTMYSTSSCDHNFHILSHSPSISSIASGADLIPHYHLYISLIDPWIEESCNRVSNS
jgi:hypothetical protein